jgi:branched-chain amino acid transport system substrate-binding protein
MTCIDRRRFLTGSAALAGASAFPAVVRAQPAPITLGTLTPLSGPGSAHGPSMRKAMEWVAEQINAAGGVSGRRIQLVSEDDQTNPETAARAARKLIGVDKVAAIMGTWGSAVAAAVAPLCWESKTFLATVSDSDAITRLPHQGYLIRTHPSRHLQIGKLGRYVVSLGSTRVFMLAANTPLAGPSQDRLREIFTRASGVELVGAATYDKEGTTFRAEIAQALRAKPDMIYLDGSPPDCTIVMRELFEAGYTGGKMAQSYGVDATVVANLPRAVSEGTYIATPSPAIFSVGYRRLAGVLGEAGMTPYACEAHDQISLVALAIARAKGDPTGTAIKDNIRNVSQGAGAKVAGAVEGLKRLAQGQSIDYQGASGPCDFTTSGDIIDCKIRFDRVDRGELKTRKLF